jgi:hypothetical protein
MMRRPVAVDSLLGFVGIGAAAALYAWWATGVPPFSPRAYIAVGLPASMLLAAAIIGPGSGRAEAISATLPGGAYKPQRVFPWVVLLVLALSLEGLGLALGGRSQVVPTFSTVIDHALSRHVVRFILFCAWLAAGWAPLLRVIHTSSPDKKGVD